MTDFTVDNIDKGIKLAMTNCYSLFDDGDLLFKNKRYPSAFALFQLCAEEQAKVKLLIDLALRKRCGMTFTQADKEFFSKFFSNHVDKIRYSTASDITFNQFAPTFGFKKLRADKDVLNEFLNPKNLDKLKQAALYVTVDKKSFKCPKDKIDRKKSGEIRKHIKFRLSMTKSTYNYYFTSTEQFVWTYKNNKA